MNLLFKNHLAEVPDLRHSLRQLRWFRATFRKGVEAVTKQYGVRYAVDDARLTRIFFDWVEIVEAKKGYARLDRADFIVFAAGMVLKEMIRQQPATAIVSDPAGEAVPAGAPEVVRFWPEGFLYTNYCISAIAALFQQEFCAAPELDACADDLRTWWSYRENTAEVPAYAVAFLDRFLGEEPNWIAPEMPEERKAMQRALAGVRPAAIGNG